MQSAAMRSLCAPKSGEQIVPNFFRRAKVGVQVRSYTVGDGVKQKQSKKRETFFRKWSHNLPYVGGGSSLHDLYLIQFFRNSDVK